MAVGLWPGTALAALAAATLGDLSRFAVAAEPARWAKTGAAAEALAEEADPWAWAGAFELTANFYTLSVERNASGAYVSPSSRVAFLTLGDGEATTEGLERAAPAARALWEEAAVEAKSGEVLDVGRLYRLDFDSRTWFSYFLLAPNSAGPVALYTEHLPAHFQREFRFFRSAEGRNLEPNNTRGDDHDHDHDHDDGQGHGSRVALNISKLLAILLMIVSAIIGIFLRLRCPSLDSPDFFAYVSVLSGSMFIAMALFHILPEAISEQPKALATLLSDEESALTIMVFVFVGFAIVLFFERVMFDAHAGADPVQQEALKEVLNPRHSFLAKVSQTGSSAGQPVVRRASLGAQRMSLAGREVELSHPPNWGAEATAHQHSARAALEEVALRSSSEAVNGRDDHGHGHGHGEAHGDGRKGGHTHGHMPEGNGMGAIILMAALSVHSVFEGIVVGTASSVGTVWLLTFIICAHKWAESFAIANQLTEQQRKSNIACILLSMFVLAIPLGVGLGWILDAVEAKMAECILNSLAVGTLLYIGMVEVIPEEFTGARNVIRKYVIFLGAAGVIFLLTHLHHLGHDHGDGGDHGHSHR